MVMGRRNRKVVASNSQMSQLTNFSYLIIIKLLSKIGVSLIC